MSVLTDLQTIATRNDLERSRADYLRVRNMRTASLAKALAETERALADTARTLARVARLRDKLRAAGIDPDAE